MKKTLERVKKAVASYRPKQKDNELRTSRSLLAAFSECKKYIDENSQSDRGCAQRIAREITEIVGELPIFQNIVADKKIVSRLHTRQLAEDHLALLQKHLEGIVKEEEKGKITLIHDWIKQHPVFDELKRAVKNSLPKNAYVLLFAQKHADDELDLVTRTAADGRVFTRFRLQDFGDDLKLHKSFNRQPAIVGAAVVAERELLSLIGTVPPAKENSDQIKTLLAISSEKASKPAKQFVEMNAVLKELNQLSHDRNIAKDAYILLFQANTLGEDESITADESATSNESSTGDESSDNNESIANDESSTNDETTSIDGSSDESSTSDEAASIDSSSDESSTNDETASIDGSSNESSTNDETASTDESANESSTSDDSSTGEETTSTNDSNDDSSTSEETSGSEESSDNEESANSEASSNQATGTPTLVVKKNKEGKIVTRFWGVDFAVSHRLFDAFRGKPAIVGAAIIKGTEIVQILGHVPQPAEGQSQLDALLNVSKSSVEKPFMDFLEDNDVLKGLHGLSKTDDARLRDAQVIFFGETDGAKVKVVYPRPGRSRAPILLNEFQSAKVVHDRFASKPKLAGASVIGISKPHVSNRAHQTAGKSAPGGLSDPTKRRAPAPVEKPVVLAAFGRTPLKANLLATPEILQRLGIDIEL